MTQALQTIQPDEWSVMAQQAKALVATGFLPKDVNTPEKALAIIMVGRELNLPPMTALNNIVVIQGKPTISPQLMLGLINRSGLLENLEVVASPEGAIVTMKRKGRAPYIARFGPDEAKKMGLAGKDNYNKQAETMYKWRAVAQAARTVFPDVILGLHTPEEAGAAVALSDTGEVLVEDTPPAQAAEPDFVDGQVDDSVEGLKQKARDLCTWMNTAGHEPQWKPATLKSYLQEWYRVPALDDLTEADLRRLVGDFEKKLAALEAEDEAEKSLAGSRGVSAVNRSAAAAQEGGAK